MSRNLLKIKQEAKRYFNHYSHGFDHVIRVYNIASIITKAEGENLDLVGPAAWLHDIARSIEFQNKNVCHAKKGAVLAKIILLKHHYSSFDCNIICEAIRTHRYTDDVYPKTKVGQILQDADRLDLLGAIGIARVFLRAGEKGIPIYDPKVTIGKKCTSVSTAINHFYEKILKLKPKTFHTKKAQELATERYKYTKEYIDRFLYEWKGGNG